MYIYCIYVNPTVKHQIQSQSSVTVVTAFGKSKKLYLLQKVIVVENHFYIQIIFFFLKVAVNL